MLRYINKTTMLVMYWPYKLHVSYHMYCITMFFGVVHGGPFLPVKRGITEIISIMLNKLKGHYDNLKSEDVT